MKIEMVVPLPVEDSGLQHCIARFHNSNMDSKRQDKARFFRREPVVIVNPRQTSRCCDMRWVTLVGFLSPKVAIALDYDAVDALGVRFKGAVELEVRRLSAGKYGNGSGTIRIRAFSCQSRWA